MLATDAVFNCAFKLQAELGEADRLASGVCSGGGLLAPGRKQRAGAGEAGAGGVPASQRLCQIEPHELGRPESSGRRAG